jgi:hypothetical protein
MQSTSPVVISAILLCFLAVAVRDGLTQERLIPFERDEMWGYKTSSGEVMIQTLRDRGGFHCRGHRGDCGR